MHCRADVVGEAGQRQLLGATAPAGTLGALVDLDREPGTGERQRRGQTVWAGADDDRVRHSHSSRTGLVHRDVHRALPARSLDSRSSQAVRSSSSLVGAIGTVVEEHYCARSGTAGKLDRIVIGGVPKPAFVCELFAGEQLRVMDQNIGPAGKLERRGVVLATAVRAGPSALGQ